MIPIKVMCDWWESYLVVHMLDLYHSSILFQILSKLCSKEFYMFVCLIRSTQGMIYLFHVVVVVFVAGDRWWRSWVKWYRRPCCTKHSKLGRWMSSMGTGGEQRRFLSTKVFRTLQNVLTVFYPWHIICFCLL